MRGLGGGGLRELQGAPWGVGGTIAWRWNRPLSRGELVFRDHLKHEALFTFIGCCLRVSQRNLPKIIRRALGGEQPNRACLGLELMSQPWPGQSSVHSRGMQEVGRCTQGPCLPGARSGETGIPGNGHERSRELWV